jgi:Uma2 family endonuclease
MNAFAKIDKETFYRFMAHRREGRYEFVRGRIVQQMTGGTRRHALIARRLTRMIEDQLDAKCWTVLPDRGVDTSVTVRYPDIVVEPASEPEESLSTLGPALIIEVLSQSTTEVDLVAKPQEYLSLPTLAAYVVASQDEPACLVWARRADGSLPEEPSEVRGPGAVVSVRARGLTLALPLEDAYRGLEPGNEGPPARMSKRTSKRARPKRRKQE